MQILNKNMANVEKIKGQFKIEYLHRVFFTENVFSCNNNLLKNLIDENPVSYSKAIVIVDDGVAKNNPDLIHQIEIYFKKIKTELVCNPITIPGGESAKNNLNLLLDILSQIEKNHLDRRSFLIAVGGGATLDITGFAAAIAHRGIRYIRIPTTTLAQCDSGVGVKNGLNLFGKKNFIGAFYPPYAVINDFNFLNSLPGRDKICGFAEAVKVALIKDKSFFKEIESLSDKLVSFHKPAVKRVIKKSARLHFEHIIRSGDPFEMGNSKPLDFGHWSAHKLEELSGFTLRHGEAVAAGIALDTVYCNNIGLISANETEIIINLLIKLGFKIYVAQLDSRDSNGNLSILKGIDEFREHLGGELSITMLNGIGRSIEINQIESEVVEKSINQIKKFCEFNSIF